jgi:hypothetical protein
MKAISPGDMCIGTFKIYTKYKPMLINKDGSYNYSIIFQYKKELKDYWIKYVPDAKRYYIQNNGHV